MGKGLFLSLKDTPIPGTQEIQTTFPVTAKAWFPSGTGAHLEVDSACWLEELKAAEDVLWELNHWEIAGWALADYGLTIVGYRWLQLAAS